MKSAKVHYIHSLSYSARDKLVGAFVLIALLFVVGLFASKIKLSKLFDSVVYYQAVMKNAQGITSETAINISGIDVGRVTDVNLDESSRVKIQFFIYKRFQPLVRADSTGEISKLSLVGDNIIIIKSGSTDQAMLQDQAIIPIKEPTVTNYLTIAEITPAIKKFTAMVTNLSEALDTLNPKVINQTSQDFQTILTDLRKISDQVSEGKGSLGRMIYDEKQEQRVVNSLAMLEQTLSGIAQRVHDVQPIIMNANQLVSESKKIMQESQQLIVEVRGSVNKIDQQLNHLPSLIDNAESVLQSTEYTLNGLQPVRVHIDNKIWPFSSNTEIEDTQLLIQESGLDE